MTLFWIIVAVIVVGLVIWYLAGKKKGPTPPMKPEEPQPPMPPPPPEGPGF